MLPSQAGDHFVNKLPNSNKSVHTLKVFKTHLNTKLIAEAFYTTDGFMAHNWDA